MVVIMMNDQGSVVVVAVVLQDTYSMNGQTSFQPVTEIQTRRPDTDEESDTDAESLSSNLVLRQARKLPRKYFIDNIFSV